MRDIADKKPAPLNDSIKWICLTKSVSSLVSTSSCIASRMLSISSSYLRMKLIYKRIRLILLSIMWPNSLASWAAWIMALYLLWAYVSPKRAVDLMVSMISCISASRKAFGEVYLSNKVRDVLVVTLENMPRYWGKAIRNSPWSLFT